jgi:hypothetical protein
MEAQMASKRTNTEQDHASEVTTEEARQGTGPRDMVAVLMISLLLAGAVGTALLAYFLA